jgi:hypothetical protein
MSRRCLRWRPWLNLRGIRLVGAAGYIERNNIALTSCLAESLDQPSAGWLGRHAGCPEISQSGLWNIDHIRHHREPGFPGRLDQPIQQQQ